MKQQIRVCGIDDAPFEFKNRASKAIVIGTVVRIPSYLEGILRFEVTVDGDDSTSEIKRSITKSRFFDQIKAIMIDGIALAGFNVIDIGLLSESMRIPVITVTRDRPDMEAIRNALLEYFDDGEERFAQISKLPVKAVGTSHNPIFVSCAGIEFSEAVEIIRASTVRGVVPEPIRMAHIIASGVVKGESKGKA